MRTLIHASILGCALLFGCAHRSSGGAADPTEVLAAARAARQPFALRGAFSVTLRRGDTSVSTRGAMVLHEPDQFRVEVMGPVGTPLVIVASDGRALNVYSAQNMTLYQGSNAPAALRELTGGALTLADVVRVLTGHLPLPGAEVRSQSVDEAGVMVTLAGPEGAEVSAHLNPKTALMNDLSVSRAGESMLKLSYGRAVKVGRSQLPGSFTLDVPALDLGVTITVDSWDELGQIPDVFTLTPPAGAEQKDLLQALQEEAVKRGVESVEPRPQP